MASGTITMHTKSVDYNNGAAYTRGAQWLDNVINWSVNDSGVISFSDGGSSGSSGGSWFVCSSSAAGFYIYLEPQVDYGQGWVSLDKIGQWVGQCGTSNQVNTITMSNVLIGKLGSYQLNTNCQLRVLYYSAVAPAPDAAYPNAFPNANYSAVTQIPVEVDVSWTARLNYNANGGANAPSNVSATVEGDSKTFIVSSQQPTRDEYVFKGWANSSNGPVVYHGGDTVTVTKGSPTKTVYAAWNNAHKLVYHYENGSPDKVVAFDNAEKCSNVTLDSTKPSRTHWVFKGWSSIRGSSIAEYQPGSTVSVCVEKHIYAVWEYTYRPGMHKRANGWYSLDIDSTTKNSPHGGACRHLVGGVWKPMRTKTNIKGLSNPPVHKRSDDWYSQNLIGRGGRPHDVSW